MSAGLRMRSALRASWLAAALVSLPGAAIAGVFDDDVARAQNLKTQKELSEFRTQASATMERLEGALKTQIELANQIEAVRSDIAKLRGQMEVLSHANETGEKRQRDFYLDLDGRLRKLEGSIGELHAKVTAPPPPAKPKLDPADETRAYEEALNQFKAAKYKDAQISFSIFLRDHPTGSFAPSAQFWLANTLYAQQDCKGAIEAHNVVVTKHPDSNKAPDSLLAIATCQQDLKDAKTARKTLEQLVAKYPQAPAAETARQRLKRK